VGGGPASAGASAQVFVADLDTLELEPDDDHHLIRVLRLRDGEVVVAADGRGGWRRCRFAPASRGDRSGPGGGSTLRPDGETQRMAVRSPAVTVGFVTAKGDRPEWAVQKLTEVGVDEIVLLRSVRSVVNWDGDRAVRALDRLRRVARSAAAQSRRAWLPVVSGIDTVTSLSDRRAPLPLAVAQAGGNPPDLAVPAVVVGPEGGWDPGDGVAGLPPVGLGPGVLRSETAAVAAGVLLCALRHGVVAHGPAAEISVASATLSEED
jgi:16S rRNA (uracil1498-N3)-methyltransferase